MKEINYKDMKFNPFNLIGGEWMLVTIAESYPQRDFHTMYVGKSKGIGQSIWKTIETIHPEIEVWETCTPYFDRRNPQHFTRLFKKEVGMTPSEYRN